MIKDVLPGPLVVAVLAAVATLVSSRTPAGPAVLFAGTVCIAACAIWLVLRVMRRDLAHSGSADATTAARRRDEVREPLKQLADLERLVSGATYLSSDAYARLRPRLRALATDLLEARHGIRADPVSDDVAALLGAPGNLLIGPPQPGRLRGTEPGPTLAEIGRTVDLLEAI
jgi:hypothetical protein